jgi:hypothetical protein
MDRQQALNIEATLKALRGLQRAVAQDDRPITEMELWNAREELKKLREMVEQEKDN